jgi:NAD+ synthase (glutamine-hydrolysing)
MPYKTSSADSLDDAQAVVDALGCNERTIEITAAVDGYLSVEPDADPRRPSLPRSPLLSIIRMASR